MRGICKLSWIPIRAKADSTSEIVSSLLFGETYKVQSDSNSDWFEILTDFDQYKGFISANQFSLFENIDEKSVVVKELCLFPNKNDFPKIIPAGAVFRGNEIELLNYNNSSENESLIELAKSFLEVPYLWGGRCFAGIDCSGFMQIIFKIKGISIPRDSGAQYKFCEQIEFDELAPEDLVFFGKNSKITHVGLYLGEGKIIHSSGKVRIDNLTKEGIIKNDGTKTHIYIGAGKIAR